jgi:hypothetical protein
MWRIWAILSPMKIFVDVVEHPSQISQIWLQIKGTSRKPQPVDQPVLFFPSENLPFFNKRNWEIFGNFFLV